MVDLDRDRSAFESNSLLLAQAVHEYEKACDEAISKLKESSYATTHKSMPGATEVMSLLDEVSMFHTYLASLFATKTILLAQRDGNA